MSTPNIAVDRKLMPQELLKDSILLNLVAAYFSVGKYLEQKTQCSQTRGFILSTLRGGASLNQNQISTLLGFDRTVVHRAVKTMIREGLLSEKKAKKAAHFFCSLPARATSTAKVSSGSATRWMTSCAHDSLRMNTRN